MKRTRPPRLRWLLVVHAALMALTGMGFLSSAFAQDPEELWQQYDVTAVDFTEAADACDAALDSEDESREDCLDAAALGLALRDIVEEILIFDITLTSADLDALAESMLFAWQRSGSYLVEAGACERAVEVLEGLSEHPLGDDYPRALVAGERWLRRANECVEGNQAAAEPEPLVSEDDDDDERAAEIVLAPFSERLPARRNGMRTAGWVLVGTSAAAIGLGYYFYTEAESGQERMVTEAEEFFVDQEPVDDFRAAQNDAQNAATASNVLYGAGIAMAVTGAILVIAAPRRRPVERPVQVMAGPQRVGIRWEF